jgi:hypothetical protein
MHSFEPCLQYIPTLSLVAVASVVAMGQTNAPPSRAEFLVASVKPSAPQGYCDVDCGVGVTVRNYGMRLDPANPAWRLYVRLGFKTLPNGRAMVADELAESWAFSSTAYP